MYRLQGLRILALVLLMVACTRTTETVPSEVGLEPDPSTSSPTTEAASSVTIALWHGWTERETEALDEVIAGFHELHPGIRVSPRSVPFDELQATVRDAWSEGGGPTLLFGASDWASDLHALGLIREVTGVVPPSVLDQVIASARATAELDGVLMGLPHSLTGVVLYRNTDLMPDAPRTLDELLAADGAVLERGFFFSMGHLMTACGGTLVNPDGTAGFADAAGECWLEILSSFPGEGAYYSDADLEAFKAGRAPVIIDGTWSLPGIIDALGEDAVAIDRWPATADGRLSGVVRSEAIYLGEPATSGEISAAATFIGYFFGIDSQLILSDPSGAGHIPAIVGLPDLDRIRSQAVTALAEGVSQPEFGDCYWGAMDTALQGFFSGSIDAASALTAAADRIDTAVASDGC